jgi:hypothetical protein
LSFSPDFLRLETSKACHVNMCSQEKLFVVPDCRFAAQCQLCH